MNNCLFRDGLKMKKSIFCVILSGILWGSVSIFINALKKYGFEAIQLAAMRNTVAAILVVIYAMVKEPSAFKIKPAMLIIFAVSGISLAATGSFYYYTITVTSPSVAVILMYTAPVIVMAVSVLFLNEKITVTKALAMLFSILGCALTSGVFGELRFQVFGIVIGLLSGIAYSVYNITAKIEMQRGSSVLSANIYCFIFAAVTGVLVAHPQQMLNILYTQFEIKMILLLVGVGVLCFTIPYFLYTYAMKKIPAGLAASMAIIEPITATIVSVVIFGEKLSFSAAAGIILVLLSVTALANSEKNDSD